MGTRGRQSKADLAVLDGGDLETCQRPGPPADLSDEEAREWLLVVNSMPADYFVPGSLGTLKQLCRHRIRANRVAQIVEQLESGETLDTAEYDKALKMQARETDEIGKCERLLRLVQSASYDRKKIHRGGTNKPWGPKH